MNYSRPGAPPATPFMRGAMHFLALAYYAFLCATGVIGLAGFPGHYLFEAAGAAAFVWSAAVALAAGAAFVARLRGAAESEAWCLLTLAALTLVHGVMVWDGTPGAFGGAQTGLRIVAGTALMVREAHRLLYPTVLIPRRTDDDE